MAAAATREAGGTVRFIRRHGQKRDIILAPDEVPESLRVGFVNLLDEYQYRLNFVPSMFELHDRISRALRRRPWRPNDPFEDIEWTINNCSWDEFYEICEQVLRAIPEQVLLSPPFSPFGLPAQFQSPKFVENSTLPDFTNGLNDLLAEEGAPWRIAEGHVVPAFSEEVEGALEDASSVAQRLEGRGVHAHLRKARQHLGPSGDKENAVKEAVSAVEAAVKEKAGVDDFDEGLKLLKQQRRLKPHWSSAIQTLFSYASNEDQVRHGSPELSDLTYGEARDLVGLAAVLTQHIAGLPSPVGVE